MTIDDIQKLIKNGETRTLELKKTTGELQDGMHSACAMLNSDGGVLVFGITPNSHKIIGQHVTDNTRQEIANAIAHFEPAIEIVPEYIDVPDIEGNQLVVMQFAPWKWGNIVYSYRGCPYYKSESTTKIMPREMFDERNKASKPQEYEWDIKPAYEIEIGDLNEERVRAAVRLGVRGNRLHASADGDSMNVLLQKLNLLTKDAKPTNAAAMLFATHPNRYPQFLLRMCRFRGKTKEVFVDPQEVYGNFFDILDAGISFCFKHLFLTGEIKGLRRVETLEIPLEALREALINALCHRDYEQIYASASLAIFDDRIEISNPGRLPIELTPETILLPHSSYPHNPLIAQVLYLTSYLDKWGSGVERIVQLCKEANISMPAYSVANRLVTLTFYRPALSDDVTKSDTKNDTKNDTKSKRTLRQQEIIKLVAENPTISIATLALRLKVSKPTIKREMFSLSDVLEHIGPTNGGYWRIRE